MSLLPDPILARLGAPWRRCGAAAVVVVAGCVLSTAASLPAAASARHGGLSHRQIIEIVVACLVALALVSLSLSLLRRSRSKKLLRETAALPYSPQAVLGRLPPGRDVYGHDLYAAEVVGGSDPAGNARAGAARPAGGGRPPAAAFAGRSADANMLSYELERLAVLRDAGTISDKEYGEARRRLLSG